MAKLLDINGLDYYNGKINEEINKTITQYSTLPTASSSNEGKIVQYIGTTDANYTNGYYYKCIGTESGGTTTYSWSNINVQGGGEPQYITDGDGSKLYYARWSTDSTYRTSTLYPILKKLIQDFDNGIKSYLLLTEDYAYSSNGREIPFNDYHAGIFFIQKVETYSSSDLKQYYVSTISPSSIYKSSLETSLKYTVIDGIINYTISTGTISSLNFGRSTPTICNLLSTTNNVSYTPTRDYNPATKKYVDDSIASAIGTALQGNY